MSNVISNYVTAHDYKVHYPNTQKALKLFYTIVQCIIIEGGGTYTRTRTCICIN